MHGYSLGVLQWIAVLQIGGDAGGAESMVAGGIGQVGGRGPPLDGRSFGCAAGFLPCLSQLFIATLGYAIDIDRQP
jgi:hypothetical protein